MKNSNIFLQVGKPVVGFIILIMLISSCSPELSYDYLDGKWKMTHMDDSNIDNNTPQVLIDEATETMESTTMEFNKDATFVKTHEKNSTSSRTIRIKGTYEIDKNTIKTEVDVCEVENEDGSWKLIEKNPMSELFYKSDLYLVTKTSRNSLEVKTKGNYNSELTLTWERF